MLAVAALLVACGPSELPPTPTSTPPASPTRVPATPVPLSTGPVTLSTLQGTVRVWLDWSPREMAGLREAAREFLAVHPGVQLEITYQPTEALLPAYMAAAAEGEAPTLLFGPSAWGPDLLRQGLVQDPKDVILAETLDSLHTLALRQVEVDGGLVGLPLELQGVVLYRNAALAADPAPTLDDLVRTAQALRGGQVVGAAFDFGFLYAGSQVHACGGSLVDAEGRVTVTQPLGACWLNLLRHMGEAGPATMNTDDDLNLFEAGRSAWLSETTARLDSIRSQLTPNQLRIDPWPLVPSTGQRMAGFVWTENAYFAARLEEPDLEAAVAFITFLLNPETQSLLSDPQGAGHVPVLREISISDPFYEQILAALQSGVPLPLSTELETYRGALFTAVRLVVLQGGDPQVALGLALQEIFASASPSPTPTPPLTPTASPTVAATGTP